MADRNEFERKDVEHKGDDSGVTPAAPIDAAPPEAAAKAKSIGDLPEVESPSISPAVSEAVPVEQEPVEPQSEPEVAAARSASLRALIPLSPSKFDNEPPFEPIEVDDKPSRFAMKPRHWRTLRLAAAVAIGASFGAIAGTILTGGFAGSPQVDVAALEEKKSMQQSMAKMAKELTVLKANLEASNKAAQVQTASLEKKLTDKVNDRINERFKKEQADVTGSITPPQTVAAATPQAPAMVDVPMPKPAPRIAMAHTAPARLPIVRDWSVRGAQNGYVYVQGMRGEIYQVVPGAPLPGLGPVESIKRQDGRWVVTTPKGIIVSMQERRFFE